MAFPLCISGSIRFAEEAPKRGSTSLHSLATALGAEVQEISVAGDCIEFTSDWNKSGRFGMLILVTHGSICISPHSVTYSCSTAFWFFTVCALAAAMTAPFLANQPLEAGIAFAGIVAGLFGLNYGIAAIRIRSFIRLALA